MSESKEQTILVIDDMEIVRETTAELLEEAGFKVITAEDGVQGLQSFQSHQPDLVLLDLRMPKMDGLQVLEAIHSESPGCPVIIISGAGSFKDAIGALRLGAWDFITKPIKDRGILEHAVNRALERVRMREEIQKQHRELEKRSSELEAMNTQLQNEIISRKEALDALAESEFRLQLALDATNDALWDWNVQNGHIYCSPHWIDILGHDPADFSSGFADIQNLIHPEDRDNVQTVLQNHLEEKTPAFECEHRMKTKDGHWKWILNRGKVVDRDEEGKPRRMTGTISDISERKRLEGQLLQAQKLESLGQLAGGIAHEINTPAQYAGDNTRFLEDAFQDLLSLMELFQKIISEIEKEEHCEEILQQSKDLIEDVDLPFLKEEIPHAVNQTLEGIEIISKIVRSMKQFAQPGSGQKQPVDINESIENTITVARNEWKYVADMVTDFDPELPRVPCMSGEFNQVILNIIINAANALERLVEEDSEYKGTITVTTKKNGPWAEIRISDTGPGIPEKTQSRIFDPFFTTKEVGKGTGQGLAIAYSVIKEKHGGNIRVESEEGKGASFIIQLPINGTKCGEE